jgi:hypothetical protein
MMVKSELTELNHNRNDDSGKNITLGVFLGDLNGITVVNLCLTGCPVKAVGEGLISCCIEGDQIPNTGCNLECQGDGKHYEEGLDKCILS